MTEAFYFGRFQPPLLKHAEIATGLATNPKVHLTIGIADNLIALTQENFLYGLEVEQLFQTTLDFLNFRSISTRLVPLSEQPFVDSLRAFFKKNLVHTNDQILVFSGSPSTIKACQTISEEFNLMVAELPDDDQTGPRSREVRAGLINSNNDNWHQLVAPTTVDFLTSSEITQRIRGLPSGEKRPWSITIQQPTDYQG